MNKDLCDIIKGLDDLIKVKRNEEGIEIIRDMIFDDYCPTNNAAKKRQEGQGGKCIGYSETVISAFIYLQETFKSNDSPEKLEKDKLAQYAILWLCYKINQQPKVNAGINDIYNNFTEYDYWNNNYHNYVEQIKKMMDTNIEDILKFYNAFEILCKMYTEFDDDTKNCTNCSQYAEKFVKTYKELNENSNHTDGSSYSQLLHTLSSDYDNLKNCCNKKKGKSCDFPPLPPIKPTKKSAQYSLESSGLTSMQSSEVTSQNSSIASKLIPVLSIFVAIPIFLGISYK
ncbi:CIR protein, partial [Plasmodium chabaudi chabaudi]